MEKTLNEIARLIDGEVNAVDGEVSVKNLSNITAAVEGDLIFAVEGHIEEAARTKASAVLIPSTVKDFPLPSIRVSDPKAAFARLIEMFGKPQLNLKVGVSERACIGEGVKLGRDVVIMPLAVIDDNATIGDGAIIYPHVYIGQHATIGSGTIIYSSATVREYCTIGARCVIHSSAVIGSDGFGFTTKDGVHTKVPQIGNVIVEDDVEIGAHVGIDRAAMGSTMIGHGTKIDNLVHIGHNCRIGANCLIVAQTGISGSTVVGDNVTFGGQVGTVGHINIGGNSVYAARSGINKSMPEGFFGAGFPVQDHGEWLRMMASLKKVPELIKAVKRLEKGDEK